VIVAKFKPDKQYFVLEGRPKKRLEVHKEYKAQRTYHDRDEFSRQKKYIISLLKRRFPMEVVRHPDYECDDVLANLALLDHKQDECIVVSSDTDFYQLYDGHDNMKIYNPVQKRVIEKQEVDYVTWKSLKGDASDNILGFTGIGNKRAAKLAADPDKLEKFLAADPLRRAKFEKNVFLIRFHDMGGEMTCLERSTPEIDWEDVRREFNDLRFWSITNDRSWEKFQRSFGPN
jgi:DNA polymerase-1